MRRTTRHPALWLAGGLAVLLGGLQAADAPPRLTAATPLHVTAGGSAMAGSLGIGTPVRILETQDDWVKVQAEGWIPAAALAPVAEGGSGATGAADGTGGGGAVAATGSVLEGRVALPRRLGRDVTAGDVQVLLLPAAIHLEMNADDDEAASLATLDDRAAELRRRAERAMAKDNFTTAVQEHDRLIAEREGVLADRNRLLAARHGRHGLPPAPRR
jgi:hypothetical protein